MVGVVSTKVLKVRIALAQIAYGDDESVADKTDRIVAALRAHPPVDGFVLPELWGPGAFNPHRWPDVAESIPGPLTGRFAQVARELGVWLHLGSLVETDGGRRYNTSVLMGADGEILNTYRKVHRFGFTSGEAQHISSGADIVTGTLPGAPEVPVGSGTPLRYGLATCYDLRFPELFRVIAARGCEVLLVTAAWPQQRLHAWRTLVQARAIENQCIVVATNTAGRHGKQTMAGHSMVVGPDGSVWAEAGEQEQWLVCELDVVSIAAIRRSFPVLADQRLTVAATMAPAPHPNS